MIEIRATRKINKPIEEVWRSVVDDFPNSHECVYPSADALVPGGGGALAAVLSAPMTRGAAPGADSPTLRARNASRLLAQAEVAAEARPFVSIPEIDVSPLFGDDFAARVAVGAQIRRACIEVGFFYAAGHGVDEGVIARGFRDGWTVLRSAPAAEGSGVDPELSEAEGLHRSSRGEPLTRQRRRPARSLRCFARSRPRRP